MSDDVEPTPEFPDHLLDQVLADPEARQALRDYAMRQGIETSLEDLSRQQLRLLAGALVAEAREHGTFGTSGGDGTAAALAAEIPAELVTSIFEDPRAQNVLQDIVAANGLQGPPAALPDNIKREIVRLLIEQGIVTFEAPATEQ
jgi:hypothetical protein